MSPKKMRLKLRYDVGFERTYFFSCLMCVVVLFGVLGLRRVFKPVLSAPAPPVLANQSQGVALEDYFSKEDVKDFKKTFADSYQQEK